MSSKRKRQPTPTDDIHRSSEIHDRSSVFTAIYSPSIPATKLQALPELKTASHRIAAWRLPSTQRALSQAKTLYTTGHDDDGEQYAGKKLGRLLDDLDVTGAVVVARWYGGVLLGPVRFKHIEACAKGAVEEWRQEQARDKRRRVEEEQAAKLRKTLEERDRSIVVLREMLAEKSGKPVVTGKTSGGSSKEQYERIDIDALRRVEKARDGTIAWILKAIDTAEMAAGRSATVEEAEKAPIEKG